ncbi:mitochondrial ribosomal protein subunit-domain-containing protein [Cristinia sonorae]|uniref:Mitochondrial ribosomal protein subunit-domain-containing protein n=1 Tax=Cristinia sonorae TaxID=1940300 RepID=A0A8K0UX09_9AGAR|nr:mitochondrial ribosomal protein subunit-domain-containing protein [Cristinia sonorae]
MKAQCHRDRGRYTLHICCSTRGSLDTTRPARMACSQFTTLLRRSKFAAHDPKIGQIYTTFGGDAHRGNYGLKRPIPISKSRGHITVSEVDSRESQTVWNNAEQPGRWIRMWDEVSVPVTPRNNSEWDNKLGDRAKVTWLVDSEFADWQPPPKAKASAEDEAPSRHVRHPEGSTPTVEMMKETRLRGANIKGKDRVAELVKEAEKVGLFTPTVDIENIHAMGDREFENYLAAVRALRPQFKEFIKVGEATFQPEEQPRDIYQFSQQYSSLHRLFLSAQTHTKFHSPTSRGIERQPHSNGGLTYFNSSRMQAKLMRDPKPGRIVHDDKSNARLVVSYGGMTTEYKPPQRDSKHATLDWTSLASTGQRDPSRGVLNFALVDAEIDRGPSVVGKNPQMLDGTVIFSRVYSPADVTFDDHNPHRPGSVEYIAHREGRDSAQPSPIYSHEPRTYATPSMIVPENSAAHTDQVMNTLGGYVTSMKPGSKV